MTVSKRTFALLPALAIAASLSLVATQVQAQATGAGSTPREVQRGVPGVDVDVNTNARGAARNNGVPGVDVDVRTNAARGGANDTRAAGAGAARSDGMNADGTTRGARADRN